jgi:hypothetical protein
MPKQSMPAKQAKPGQGVSRAARRRRRNRQTQPITQPIPMGKRSNKVRTLDTITRDLARATINPKGGKSWLSCRLNPWSNIGSMSLLPDGSSDPRLVYDYYTYGDIAVSAAATGFNIGIFAALPWNAAVKVLSGKLTLTPMFTDGGVSASACSASASKWTPLNYTNSASAVHYPDKINTGFNPPQFISADKMRITSLGWRLTYTGPVSTAAGIVTVTSSPPACEPAFEKIRGKMNWSDAQGVVGGFVITSNASVMCLPITPPSAVAQKDAVMARPEKTLQGIVRKNTPIFNWQNWANSSMYMVSLNPGEDILNGDLNSLTTAKFDASGTYTNSSTSNMASVNLFDSDWDIPNINVSGCNADATYRLETWMCVEYVPLSNSVYYSVASKDMSGTIETVSKMEKIVNDKPVAEQSNAGA